MSVEKSMEHYTLYFKDVCLGALTVDSLSGEYAFEPDTAGVQLAREETVLIREIEEGTSGFVPPIPFFSGPHRSYKAQPCERFAVSHGLLRPPKAKLMPLRQKDVCSRRPNGSLDHNIKPCLWDFVSQARLASLHLHFAAADDNALLFTAAMAFIGFRRIHGQQGHPLFLQ